MLSGMTLNSKEHQYWKDKRRIEILSSAVFLISSLVLGLTIARVFSLQWTEGWVMLSGFSLGFVITLVAGLAMAYALDKKYDRVTLSLWAYASIRLRFLFVIYLVPVVISIVIALSFSQTSYSEMDPFLLLPRTLILVMFVLFSGYLFPILLTRITGARETKHKDLISIIDEVSKQVGINVQAIYEVPLKGLRTVNAAQVGFVKGRRSVFLFGDCEKFLTKEEIRAILAHEFVHAKRNHLRRNIIAHAFAFVGVPGLIFLFTDAFIKVLDIPIPVPLWVVITLVPLAVILIAGSILFAQWLSRRYETEADLEAADMFGSESLISALLKLAELNMIQKGQSSLLSTHPSIEDRVRALEARDALSKRSTSS